MAAPAVPRLALAQWGDGLALGGLAVVCVRIDARAQAAFTAAPPPPSVPDPARLETDALTRESRRLMAVVAAEVVDLSARKYNSVVQSAGRADRVLDWAYRKAVEGLAVRYPGTGLLVHDARAPAFALVEGEVRGTDGMKIRFVPLREQDFGPGVAVVIARAHYAAALRRSLGALGVAGGSIAERGAGDDGSAVTGVLARLLEAHGRAGLLKAAKRDHPAVDRLLNGAAESPTA